MWKNVLYVVLVAILVRSLIYLSDRVDFQRKYNKHHPGKCSHVRGHTFGSEDIATTSSGLAFISTGLLCEPVAPGLYEFYTFNHLKGGIYLFDFGKPDEGVVRLQLIPSKTLRLDIFHPHGLSLLEDATNGEHLVYVINHPENQTDTVEKFQFIPGKRTLQHLQTFQDDAISLADDLLVVDVDQFYITNFLYFIREPWSVIELAVPLRFTNVVFYNGENATAAYSGVSGANGIAISRNGRYVYMCEFSSRKLLVLERSIKDNSLKLKQTLTLNMMPDNVNLNEDGTALLIGGHPKFFSFINHMLAPLVYPKSPSMVLHLPLQADLVDEEKITEIFYDHGDLISASSSAANVGKNLLIGSINDKLVYCETNLDI